MKSKKERTLEAYEMAGAYLRVFKYVYYLGWDYLQPVMPKQLWDRWNRIQHSLNYIQSELEDRLFREHAAEEKPGENFIRMFYGEGFRSYVLSDERKYHRQACDIVEKEFVEKLNDFRSKCDDIHSGKEDRT